MSMILLAVEDADRDAAVRDLLTAEGWWVTTVSSQEEALRAAADHAPKLLIVDRRLAEPGGLLRAFGREVGGPGVLLLVDQLDGEENGGDGVVARNQDGEEVVSIVRQSLEAPSPAEEGRASEPESESAQLTATDLFGDILSDLEETRAAAAAAALVAVSEGEDASDDEPSPDLETSEEGSETVDLSATVALPVEALLEEALRESSSGGSVGEDELVSEPEPEPEPEIETGASAEAEAPADVDPEDEITAVISAITPSRADGSEAIESVEEAEAEAETVDGEFDEELEEIFADPTDDPGVQGPEQPTTDLDEEVAEIIGSLGGDAEAGEADQDETSEEYSLGQVLDVEDDGTSEEAPEAPTEPAPDHNRLGAYRLNELLEFGAMTERWLAEGPDDELVVVERLRHDLRDRSEIRDAFVEGYSEAAGWESRNVLRVLDLGRHDEVDYVVTEYLAGHSLREVLSRVNRMEARMPLGIALLIAEKVVNGLGSLVEGASGSRHGWLVPDSVWLTRGGEVLLREFGCGRLGADEGLPNQDWTELRFFGPEHWTGETDTRSDLYSVGAVLYEMISGRPVHNRSDPESLAEAVRSDDVLPVQHVDPTVPSEIDAWIMRLLRREANDRPQAVSEVASKIDLALQALPARPDDAELEAYVRQLFAANVPVESSLETLAMAMPDPDALLVPVEGEEEREGRLPALWMWIAAVVVALVLAFFGWKWFEARDSSLSESPQEAPAPAAPAPRTTPEPIPVDETASSEARQEPAAVQPPAAAPAADTTDPDEDLDVRSLVEQAFERRQRELEDRLAQEAAAAAEAAAADLPVVDPPADDTEPPADEDDNLPESRVAAPSRAPLH